MAKDPTKSSSAKPSSSQLQEKLQQLKNFYEQGQTPVQEEPSKKKTHNSVASPKPKVFNQKGEIEKDNRQISNETKNIQQEAERKRFLQMKLALDWLIDAYPICFSKSEPKPLKRHIEKDIFTNLLQDLPFSRLSIRKAIAYYTRSAKYRQALINNSHRYDLQGKQVEEIKTEHQQLAQEQLIVFAERQKVRAENKKRFSKKHQPRSESTQEKPVLDK